MSQYSTQRESKRVLVYCPVTIWGDPALKDGVCVNISKGGMALSIARPLAEGTLLRVSAYLPCGRILEATAVVIWSRSGREHRVGISFLSLKEEALETVTDFVEAARAA